MALGIHSIGCYKPEPFLDVIELGAGLEASEDFIRSKIGFTRLGRKLPEEETSDMCVRAFEKLPQAVDPQSVEALVVVSQNPDGYGLPHTSAVVHDKLGLSSDVACFDISLGCSGYVQGLVVLTAFMEAQGFKKGLLFTADPYSKVIDQGDRNTAILFGDAAACTVVSDEGAWRLGKTLHFTAGNQARAIRVDSGRKLTMEGNRVFRFVARAVPKQIKSCIEANGHSLSDIDLFLFHQGSKYIIETLRKNLKLAPELVPFGASETGNTVSSSLPLLLGDALSAPERKLIVLSGFGVGLQAATTVLSRKL